jgi:TrmH family RNA methyltransferase
MGSLFARPPARAGFDELRGTRLALDPSASRTLGEAAGRLTGPVVLCLGAEREGLPDEVRALADTEVRIPLREDGPESLNVAMAATIALWDLSAALRMAGHA